MSVISRTPSGQAQEEVEEAEEGSGSYPYRNGVGSARDDDDAATDRGSTIPGGDASSQTSKSKDKKKTLSQRIKALWAKTQLDTTTMKIMAKGALSPTISLAAYQATDFADVYSTIGYLVGIISILSFGIMPRAKFLQTIFFNMISTCLAACTALLALYCVTQARLHTQQETGTTTTAASAGGGLLAAPYNSSASVVAAIWLFAQVYMVNTLRARNPNLTIPGIIWCIFANISMVYGALFPTMTTATAFIVRLLKGFFTGFAIGAGVSLIIFPITMRGVVFKEMTGYIMTVRKTVKANMTYLHSLEERDMFFYKTMTNEPQKAKRRPEAQAVKDVLAGLTALHGKLTVDLTFAKREIAIGCLGPDDLQEIFRHLRSLLQPVVGLSSVVDVFERIAETKQWNRPVPNRSEHEIDDPGQQDRFEAVEDWNAIMRSMNEPFTSIANDIDEGLEHVLLTLRFIKSPKKNTSADVETSGDEPRPGEKGYAAFLGKKVERFHTGKLGILRRWCDLRGFKLAPDFFEHPRTAEFTAPEWYLNQKLSGVREVQRRRLYHVLYMDFLLDSIARATYEFVLFADAKVASGKLGRRHLIVPGSKRLRKWIKAVWSEKEDSYADEQHGMNEECNTSHVFLGDAYNARKDPEHLPPSNIWQKMGDHIRGISHFLRKPASAFGFRVACATMCLAVIAYLHETQTFYIQQRLFWSQIMVTISMTPSSGQSVFSFFCRILGTTGAMVTSFIIWYIVDGHTAGVLVFFWFFVSWGFYIVLKYPRFIPVGMIFTVTNTLIIGYELQVKKIGIPLSTSNGQLYYPIYELAPYRLATVAAGLFVGWVWTIFPYPISEHSELRRNLGSSLYLLANYYSIVAETVRVRVRGNANDFVMDKKSPLRRLEKMRLTVFSKSMLMLQALRTHSAHVKFDVPIGGRFPKATYDSIISRIQDIVNFAALMSYTSNTFSEMHAGVDSADSESNWLRDFRRIIDETSNTSLEITTLLTLMSAAVSSGVPLPPFLRAPESFELAAKMERLDADMLSVRHMAEPGYSAFAVMQVATKCVSEDLGALLNDIRALVGELDFSFHVVSLREQAGSSDEASAETLRTWSEGKEREREGARSSTRGSGEKID